MIANSSVSPPRTRFVRVSFERFKAFDTFNLRLRHLNVLVGPNNSGKSTILAAFRILAAAMRRAGSRSPIVVPGFKKRTLGHAIDLADVSVAEENIFFNYDDTSPATVSFDLSDGNRLTLWFPEPGVSYLIPDAQGSSITTPSAFKKQFNCHIGFVPILGPVEHHERLVQIEAARKALYNYGAARNFRNIWYHYPEHFEEFRSLLQQTWPGMDIAAPTLDHSHEKPRLIMFCPEERMPREIFWSGFGFQVWCQMLTHLVKAADKSIFLIDEPDIYLHSDLQRQLLGLLANLGPDILVATHSTEIVSEVAPDDIVVINKSRKSGKRIKNLAELTDVFATLGSNLNPILTQIAKTRRVVFVEGADFQILSRFAKKLNLRNVANRTEFAVVPIQGFSPDRARTLKKGIEATLGTPIKAAVILDADFRSHEERKEIVGECETFCDLASIHDRKEIENFLLVPGAINSAAAAKAAEQGLRAGKSVVYADDAPEKLAEIADQKKTYVFSQVLYCRKAFQRRSQSKDHETTITEDALSEFEERWNIPAMRLCMIPGKEVLAELNQDLQKRYGISLTPTAIINSMGPSEVPADMTKLLTNLVAFAKIKS